MILGIIGPFGVITIAILVLTLMPSNEVPSSSGIQLDKIVHFVLFFSFAFSLIIGLLKQYFWIYLDWLIDSCRNLNQSKKRYWIDLNWL